MIGAVKIVSYICSVNKLSEAELLEFENLQNTGRYIDSDFTYIAQF
jgi:hypothetical protein